MDKNYLISILNEMPNPKRDNRQHIANIVYENKKLFDNLVSLTFDVNNKISIKASWILEWICTHEKLEWIIPHLDKFTQNISNLHFDSAIRPCAKICEYVATDYISKKTTTLQSALTTKHIEAIVSTGFDWLITPQKTAVRAYTMSTLYSFGLEKKWIHDELKHLISTKIINESKGCKARGTKILYLIKKHQKN